MAPAAPQVFNNISPAQYAILVQKASAAGLDLSGTSGTASQFGVEVEWNYSAEAQELRIQCLSAPFFMSVDAVNAKIKTMVEETVSWT